MIDSDLYDNDIRDFIATCNGTETCASTLLRCPFLISDNDKHYCAKDGLSSNPQLRVVDGAPAPGDICPVWCAKRWSRAAPKE